MLTPSIITGKNSEYFGPQAGSEDLSYHIIKDIKFRDASFKYPRRVGKNSRLGHHGHGPRLTFCFLTTNQGAEGMGLIRGSKKSAEESFSQIKGKKVSELFSPSIGTLDKKTICMIFVYTIWQESF